MRAGCRTLVRLTLHRATRVVETGARALPSPLARIPAPLPLLPARARPRPRRRPVHKGREDPVPGPGQCGQDNAAAHAEARPHWLARADAAPRACPPALGARARARAHSRSRLPRVAFPRLQGESELTVGSVHFKAFDLGGHETGASARLRAAPRLPPPSPAATRSRARRPLLAAALSAQRGNCGRRTFPLSTPSSTSLTRCVA